MQHPPNPQQASTAKIAWNGGTTTTNKSKAMLAYLKRCDTKSLSTTQREALNRAKQNTLSKGRQVILKCSNNETLLGYIHDISYHTKVPRVWVHFDGPTPSMWVNGDAITLTDGHAETKVPDQPIPHPAERIFFLGEDDLESREHISLLASNNQSALNENANATVTPRRQTMQRIGSHLIVEGTDTKSSLSAVPQRIPRVPHDQEHRLPPPVMRKLISRRACGSAMDIEHNQIWAHEDTLTGQHFSGTIWYNSFDVGKVVGKTIPRAMSDGYPRFDEFATPELPRHAPIIEHNFINAQQLVNDLEPFTKDRTLLHNILCGTPQSFMGIFDTVIHKNLPMEESGRKKVRDSILNELTLNRCTNLLTMEELLEIVPIVIASPTGVIPKNSGEASKLERGTHSFDQIKTRIIMHASKKNKANGQSVNSETSYETLHAAEFIRLQDVEKAILDAVIRLKELGFEDHTDRILVWKCDIKSAYRIMMTALSDHWLGVHGIDDKFVVEHVAQFGQKASVTMFHRFIYALTSLMSQPAWAQDWFPSMSMPRTPEPCTARPTRDKIEKELQRFRDDKTGQGILDPDVFCWIAWYLDDFIGICLDVRDDITEPLDPDKHGIRNPLGKAIAFFLTRYGIQENLEKRKKDNDLLFMGNKKPVVLGVLVDVNALRVYVRPDYKESLITIIDRWVDEGHSKKHSAAEWGLLEGRLGFTMMVYPHFRCFLREIWMTYATILNKDAAAWCANNIILENLHCMREVLQDNPGRSIRHNRQWRTGYQRGLEFGFTPYDISHDASTGYGFGFMNVGTSSYYYRKWKGKELQLASKKKIYILEAAAMFMTFVINADSLKESNINMLGDNEGLVASFHWCGSSVPIVNAIIREFVKLLSKVDIVLNCDVDRFQTGWIDTHEMKGADALSRDALDEFKQYVQEKFPEKTFTEIPNTDSRVLLAEKLWKKILDTYVK